MTQNKTRKKISENSLILNDSFADFARTESYKSIRTNIMFSLPKSEEGKVIVITSSIPNEGKTDVYKRQM